MEWEKALEVVKENYDVALHDWDDLTDEYQENQVLAFDLAMKAIKKQIPKKIIHHRGNDLCPTCAFFFGLREQRKKLMSWKMDYCKECGQRLDWGEKK